MVKNLPANAGDASIPGSGRSSGGGNGNPLQYSWLGNPTDRGAWQTTVHRVTKELDMTTATEHIFCYGKGETTFATTATRKIYSKNKSVQNKSVSELKKSTEKEDFMWILNPILKYKRNKSIIGHIAPVCHPLPPGSTTKTSGSWTTPRFAGLINWCPFLYFTCPAGHPTSL